MLFRSCIGAGGVAIGSATRNEFLLPTNRTILGIEADQVQSALVHSATARRDRLVANDDNTAHASAWQFGAPCDVFLLITTEFDWHFCIDRDATRIGSAEHGPIGVRRCCMRKRYNKEADRDKGRFVSAL